MQNLKKNRVYRVAVVGGGISGLAAINRLLERAKEEAKRLNDDFVGTEHLFISVVQEDKGDTKPSY